MIQKQQRVGSSLYIWNQAQFYKVNKGLNFYIVYTTVPTKSCDWTRDSPQVLAQRTTVLGLFTDNMTPIHMAAGQFPPSSASIYPAAPTPTQTQTHCP